MQKLKSERGDSVLILVVFVALALGLGIFYKFYSHAGGAGSNSYVPPLTQPKNVTLYPENSFSNKGVLVSWDTPPDYAKVDSYELYDNGKLVGTYGVSGVKTPKRITDFFPGTFRKGDTITLTSVAKSTASDPATWTSSPPAFGQGKG